MIPSLFAAPTRLWNKHRRIRKEHAEATRIRKQMYDAPAEDLAIIDRVRPCTMLSPERLLGFMEAARYVVRQGVPGVIVECGVWAGGAVSSAMLALKSIGEESREFHLFDTFEGMTQPTEFDRRYNGRDASVEFQRRQITVHSSHWCRAEIDRVRENVLSTGYNPELVHFVKGRVEDTLPAQAPEQIAVLRLDTDWYESTRHELEHLYPRLARGGVLIIDDYGCWQGARKAVDEYFANHAVPMLLQRTDCTGRMGVKI
jgi:O-methyltransferase